MCTCPITIKNPSYQQKRTITRKDGSKYTIENPYARLYNTVPCGKCPECLQAKKDGYFIRCRNEFHEVQERGFFLTLTYDNNNLPYIYYRDDNDDSKSAARHRSIRVSLWNKRHVQAFLKAINEKALFYIGKSLGINRLRRLGNKQVITKEWKDFLKDSPRPFKYLCVCERGKADIYIADNGKKRTGTSRPHYHVILFVEDERLPMDVANKIITSSWTYGSCYNLIIKNDKGGYDRNALKAIEYVCKYVSKEQDFGYYSPQLQRKISMNELRLYDKESRLCHLPFTLVSNNLGIGWLERVGKDKLINEIIPRGITVKADDTSKPRQVNVPTYYIRKAFYDKHLSYDVDILGTQSFKSNLEKKVFFTVNPYLDTVRPHSLDCVVDIDMKGDEYLEISEDKRHIYYTPNSYGEQYVLANLDRKAEYYCNTLRQLKKHIELLGDTLANCDYIKSRLSFSLSFYEDIIMQTNGDDLYDYITTRYGNGSSNESDYYLDAAIDALQAYKHSLTVIKRIKREASYKANLHKAQLEKPNLFNVKPI